jgi:hypothetical protein
MGLSLQEPRTIKKAVLATSGYAVCCLLFGKPLIIMCCPGLFVQATKTKEYPWERQIRTGRKSRVP